MRIPPEAPVFLLFFFVAFNLTILPGTSNEVCISPGGRFPPFSSEGRPPRKASKGPKNLALCSVFRKNTCCDIAQTYPALFNIRRLASVGEANQECLHLWELLECSICDPRVGTQPGPPVICTSLCDRILSACSAAYFSIDAKSLVLSPCGLNDILCGRASNWAANGTEFCLLAGFSVQSPGMKYHDNEEKFCHGGRASLDAIHDSWKFPTSGLHQKSEIRRPLQDFQQWAIKMLAKENVSWAVGGLVLTAGLLFLSKRKSYSRRQKQAAVLRTAKKLEVRASHQPLAGIKGTKR